MAGLTPKQAAFVREYLVDLNATQAAIRAGYSAKTAETQGSRLYRNVQVRAAIDAKLNKTAERFELQRDEMLRELHRIATCDPGKAFDPSGRLLPVPDMPEDVRRALSGYDVDELWAPKVDEEGREQVGDTKKLKFWGKVEALRLALTHLGELTEKVDLTSKGKSLGLNIVFRGAK